MRVPQLCTIMVGERPVIVSVHAARRWAERVRGDTSRRLKEIRLDIEPLACHAEWTEVVPCWQRPNAEDDQPDGWVMFGPDIAMVVFSGVAVTVVTRGMLADEARRFRNTTRRDIRQGKRMAAKARGGAIGRDHGDKLRLSKRRKVAGG